MLRRTLITMIAFVASILLIYVAYKLAGSSRRQFLASYVSSSQLGLYKHYAVSTDAALCARVGSQLLDAGGHAVDAAIGVLLCMGIVIPNSMGLGGGGFIIVYNNNNSNDHAEHREPYAISIDGREEAPHYASEDMFGKNASLAARGPLSVGVPGELSAYAAAHKMFGRLEWHRLFEQAIRLAEEGVPLVEHMKFALDDEHSKGSLSEDLELIYSQNDEAPLERSFDSNNNSKEKGDEDIVEFKRSSTNNDDNNHKAASASHKTKRRKFKDQDTLIKYPALAKTLRRIAKNGPDEFYGGQTGKAFVEDLKAMGGKLSVEDLTTYQARVSQAYKFEIDKDLDLFTQPLPGSGLVLSIILRVMQKLGYNSSKLRQPNSLAGAALYYHHFIEACKFAYGQRAALEDYPRLDENGDEELLSYLEKWEAQQPKSWAEKVVMRQPWAKFANGTSVSEQILRPTASQQRKVPRQILGDEEKQTNSKTRERLDALIARLSSSEYIESIVANISHQTKEPSFYGADDFFALDSGTAHVSVVDKEGNAVSATTSINLYFGAGLVSKSTGLIYNDVMDDFVSPHFTNKFDVKPSKYNRIRAGRRPLSSMAPSVFVDPKTGSVKLVVGASGGSKITSAIGLVSARHAFSHANIKQSIDAPRIHHQLYPNKIIYENDFPLDLITILQSTHGHQVQRVGGRSSVVMAIAAEYLQNEHDSTLSSRRIITANSDYRKRGAVSGH